MEIILRSFLLALSLNLLIVANIAIGFSCDDCHSIKDLLIEEIFDLKIKNRDLTARLERLETTTTKILQSPVHSTNIEKEQFDALVTRLSILESKRYEKTSAQQAPSLTRHSQIVNAFRAEKTLRHILEGKVKENIQQLNNSIQNVKEQVEALFDKNLDNIANRLSENAATVSKSMDSSNQDLKPKGPHVSFSAKLADKAQTVRQNELVVFNDVSNNDMDGYDSKTGIFKAPQSGVYLFMYFIEIDGAFGKVELRLNNKSVSTTTIYGMFIDIGVSGFNHNITFVSKKVGEETVPFDNSRCVGERISASGYNHNIRKAFDSCPYKDGVQATGGNSVVIPVHAGDQVWIQNSENTIRNGRGISIRPYGSTFTGVLLTEDK